jgi:NodT family efflux transporter outer membrane factor (OMF) lipoprotein
MIFGAVMLRTSLPVALVAALMTLAGCAAPDAVQPRLLAVDAESLGVVRIEPVPLSPDISPWWLVYGDARLSALVEQALAGSPNMQVALARLRGAAAQLNFAQATETPQVQASAEVDRQRYTANGILPKPLAGSIVNTGALQLESSWEIDLFGKQRAEMQSSIGQVRASEADVQAARLLLSSQVARSYVALGRLQAQMVVLQATLKQREDIFTLICQRVQAGMDTAVVLRQGEGALPDVRVQIEALGEQIMLARHALAMLTGQAPNAMDALDARLDALSRPTLPKSIPLDLLARRADVMAARWRVEASRHESDAARALFYPNVDLSSYAGYNAIGLDRLLKAGSWQWGLMPAIHLPLFDGDRRLANLQGRVAQQDASVAMYNQTVLQAVQESADQLASLQSIARQQAEQGDAQSLSEAAYVLAKERFSAGLGNYLDVLTVEAAVLSQRRQAVDLQARALDAQFSLVRALGGSLQPTAATAPPSTGAVQSNPPTQHQPGAPA